MPDAGGMETASVGLVILGPAVVAAIIGVDVVGCCAAGVVGCTEGCDAGVVAGTYIMDKLIRGEYKRVLFVPTGALLSTVSYNEGKSVPGIAHGVILEGKES